MKRILLALITLLILLVMPCCMAENEEIPVSLDNGWVEMREGRNCVIDVKAASQVVIDIFASGSGYASLTDMDGQVIDSNSVYPGTAAYPGTGTLIAWLSPGKYVISAYSTGASIYPARVRARGREMSIDDTGDNGDMIGAYEIAPGRRYNILRSRGRQYDYYKLAGDGSESKWYLADVESITSSVYFSVLKGDATELYNTSADFYGGYGQESASTRVAIYFPSGAKYLRVTTGGENSPGAYSFLLESPPIPRRLKLPKTLLLAPGFSSRLIPAATPYIGALSDLKWQSGNPRVATVDAFGNVEALSKGTAKITVRCGKAKASCNVTVKANEYVRNKPGKAGKDKYVYAFTKRVGYSGGKFTVEVFLVNRTGKTITGSDCVFLRVIDKNYGVYGDVQINGCVFATPLRNGSTQVYKAEIPKKDAEELFLPSGAYRVDAAFSGIEVYNDYQW